MNAYSVKEVTAPCAIGGRRAYVIQYEKTTTVSESTPSREAAEDLCKWMNTAYKVGWLDCRATVLSEI